MIKALISIVLLLMLAGCEKCDQLTSAACTLEEKLEAYDKNNEPKEIINWVLKYHGEAPGSELMNRFVYWGNRNITQMEKLLALWPEDSKKIVIGRIKWAAKDSRQIIKFETE